AGQFVQAFSISPSLWVKHPKANHYESFKISQLGPEGTFEASGYNVSDGIYPADIDNSGAIVGYGYLTDTGLKEAFLLLPFEMIMPDETYQSGQKPDAKQVSTDVALESNPSPTVEIQTPTVTVLEPDGIARITIPGGTVRD